MSDLSYHTSTRVIQKRGKEWWSTAAFCLVACLLAYDTPWEFLYKKEKGKWRRDGVAERRGCDLEISIM